MSGRRLLVLTPATALACVIAIVVTTAGATTPSSGPDFSAVSGQDRLAGVEPVLLNAASRLPPTPGTRILVVGDSVAEGIGESAEALQASIGIQVRSATMQGCLLDDNVRERALPRSGAVDQAVEWLSRRGACVPVWIGAQQRFRPNNIVVIYGSGGGFQELELGGTWVGPCDDVYRDWYEPRFRLVLGRLSTAGTTVNIARLPHLVYDWWPPDANQRIDCVNAMNERVARTTDGVRILDLAAFVCPAGQCREQINGVDYRADGMHFSPEAATEIAHWLAKQVLGESVRERPA